MEPRLLKSKCLMLLQTAEDVLKFIVENETQLIDKSSKIVRGY